MDREIYDFIHIPKTAGCSFYSLIELHSDKISYKGHNRATKNKSIAIVRNPYDRLVSAYFYFKNNKELEEKIPEYKKIISRYRNFQNFVLSINRNNLIEKLIHLKPMSYWVCDENNNVIPEKIFKIEDPDSIDCFMRELGIPESIKGVCRNTSTHKQYKNYMNRKVIFEINKIYSLDFKLFNYPIL